MATAQQQHNKISLMRVESSLHRLRQQQQNDKEGIISILDTHPKPTSSMNSSFQYPSTRPLPPPPPYGILHISRGASSSCGISSKHDDSRNKWKGKIISLYL